MRARGRRLAVQVSRQEALAVVCLHGVASQQGPPLKIGNIVGTSIDGSLGKIPTTSARRFTSLFSRSSGFVLCSLVRLGEVQMRQNVGLAVVDECRELRPLLPQLIGHVTQRLAGVIAG